MGIFDPLKGFIEEVTGKSPSRVMTTDPVCSCCKFRTYEDGSPSSYAEVCDTCFVQCIDFQSLGYGPCKMQPAEEGISDQEFEKYRNKLLKKIK